MGAKTNKKLSPKKQNMILEGSLITTILTLAIPIVINSFIQTMYNLIDTYWLGQIGTNPMAAITLVSPVQNIIINFGMGITTAGAILISQYLGAKQLNQAKNMATHIFVCSMIFAFVCSVLCFFATPGIVGWLGADGEIFDMGVRYLQIVVLDMPFLFMINLFTAINQAHGDTVRPMLLNTFGIVLNIFLAPLFLLVFHWGVAGAALATLVAKIPAAAIAFYSITRKNKEVHITFRNFKFEKSKVTSIIKIGLPTALGGSTMQFGFLLMTKNVLKYGALATAAYGIGNKINGIISMPSNGIGSATSTIVGQNMGARKVERADKAYNIAMRMAVLFLLVGGIILSRRVIATPIVSIFTKDPEVIRMATDFLCIMAICSWTNGIYNATIGLFQGSGHTMITMLVDASRLWVFRFLALYICEAILHMGVASIWYSVVISNATSSAILLILYKTGIWKKQTVNIEKDDYETVPLPQDCISTSSTNDNNSSISI